MANTKLLSSKNIPEEVLVGKGTMTVLECANKRVFEEIEKDCRGHIFHLEHEGRFFIKAGKDILNYLKPIIED